MRKLTKRITAMGAAVIMIASVSAIGVSAVVIDKTFNDSNEYLSSTQTYAYDSDKSVTSASNLTICKKNNYTAILSCAEIQSANGGTYANATDFRPSADTGSFLKVTANKNIYYEDLYAQYWSYVRDENGNNQGEIKKRRKIEF